MPATLKRPSKPTVLTDAPQQASVLDSTREDDRIIAAFDPDKLALNNLDWVSLVWIGLMHVGCLAAPFFFTWQALGVAVLLHWLTGSLGVCLAYHRYLTHRSFKLKTPAEFFVMLCAVLSGEGSPMRWTAVHRLHHQRSDHEGDPHSPLHGKWWSHMLWLFIDLPADTERALYERYVPELTRRPVMRFFEKTYGWWLVASGIALFAIGGWPMLLWALCVRMTLMYHCTWFVNSATHLWGYRNYETRDESRNLWWVALVSYGEGWHNNHHAHPSVAPAGHRWWEIDMTWWAIRTLRFCGLASEVRDNVPQTAQAAD